MRKLIISLKSLLCQCLMIIIIIVFNYLPLFSLGIPHDPHNIDIKIHSDATIECTLGTWTGASNTNWDNSSNWCNGRIPSSTIDVIIPQGGNQPIINSSATCRSITINAGASLTIMDANTLHVYGNWNNNGSFIANLSTVIFSGVAQSINETNGFHNVTIGGNGIKSNSANTIINGILSMEGGSLSAIALEPIYGPHATLRYNSIYARTSGPEWVSPFSSTGGIIIDNIGPITLNTLKTLYDGVPLSINMGATLVVNNSITLGGDFHNKGNFTLNASVLNVGPGAAIQLIDGFSTNSIVSINKSGGSVTFIGAVNGGELKTIEGTLNLFNGLTHTFKGIWYKGNGTVNCETSTIRFGSSISGSGGIFNPQEGTVEFFSQLPMTIPLETFNNLILSGGNKSLGCATHIKGNLTIKNDTKCNLTTFVSSARTLTLGNYGQVSGFWGSTSSDATYKNNNFFYITSGGKLSVTDDSSLPGLWVGKTSSNWETESNWSDNKTPTRLTDVIITTTGSSPVIYGAAICKNLLILPLSNLSINGNNSLSLSGDWTNEGSFTSNFGTVTFDGVNQGIGIGDFKNITFGGSGVKTIMSEIVVNGILSMEGTANLSGVIRYATTAILQYNRSIAKTIGIEWLPTLPAIARIVIKNTGTITLNSNRNVGAIPVTISQGSTLNLEKFNFTSSGIINLECGGQTTGSVVEGTGKLILGGQLIVANAGIGTGAATINCPVEVSSTLTCNISDGNPNNINLTDLWVNTIDLGTLTKIGMGTMSNRGSSILNYLTINEGNFTIQPLGSLTVNGKLINTAGPAGLSLLSDVTGTGSLIVSFSATGLATIKRFMTPGAWHLVSSPLENQPFQDFLNKNAAIPNPTDGSDFRGMRAYDPINNQWGDFFTSATTGNLNLGNGYCIRVMNSIVPHEVTFIGALQAGAQTIANLSAGDWNCIGNPYTSAIGINDQGLGTNTANFLSANTLNIDPAYGVYIWDKTDDFNGAPGKYTTISNVPNPAYPYYYLQQGQGFMIKMAALKTSVSFTKAMQMHLPSLTLKSTEDIWPNIQLLTIADNTNSSTLIAFHEKMTNGLDPTYDAGLLKSGSPIDVYTRLVNDYGIPFAIQALPADAYDKLVIPIGVDYARGGLVNFSAKSFYLPSSCRPILEDRLTGIITDLSDNSYTVNLTANTSGTGRFYLHTSYFTTEINNSHHKSVFSARINKDHLYIQGMMDKNTRATLLDIGGRYIGSWQMAKGNDNVFHLPNIKHGIYLLYIQHNGFTEISKLANIHH